MQFINLVPKLQILVFVKICMFWSHWKNGSCFVSFGKHAAKLNGWSINFSRIDLRAFCLHAHTRSHFIVNQSFWKHLTKGPGPTNKPSISAAPCATITRPPISTAPNICSTSTPAPACSCSCLPGCCCSQEDFSSLSSLSSRESNPQTSLQYWCVYMIPCITEEDGIGFVETLRMSSYDAMKKE